MLRRNSNSTVKLASNTSALTVCTDSEIELDMPNTQIVIYPSNSELLQTALTSIQIIEGSQEEIMTITEQNEEILPITLAAGKRKATANEHTDIEPKAKRPRREPSGMIKGCKNPWKIANNSKGNVIVTEFNGNRVSIFTSNGQLIKRFGKKGSKNGQFQSPAGVSIDDDDNIYVTEYNGHRVQKFSREGVFLLVTGSRGLETLQFDTPDGVAYNRQNGKIYVCEEVNCRIQVLNKDLTFYKIFGKAGIGKADGDLNGPSGIDFDKDGHVYIADTENHRIQMFTPEGEFIQFFGTPKMGISLQYPTDIAISHDTGVVHVTTTTEHPVWKFNKEGEYIDHFGGKGIREGQFKDGSTGIAITADGAIFVTDRGSGRVQIF